MTPDANNIVIYLLAGSAAVILIVCGVAALARFANEFSQEMHSLNAEIKRTQGEERQYWMERRRRLWLSLLPFVKY